MNKPAKLDQFDLSPRATSEGELGKEKRTMFKTMQRDGEEPVVMVPLSMFEAMEDALDLAEASSTLAAIKRGEEPVLTGEELDAYLAAPTPLAYWRKKRGMTQKKLATKAQLSQGYIAELEGGKKEGSAAAILRLAQGLNVRMEDLMEA